MQSVLRPSCSVDSILQRTASDLFPFETFSRLDIVDRTWTTGEVQTPQLRIEASLHRPPKACRLLGSTDYSVPAPEQLKQLLAHASKTDYDQAMRELQIALHAETHAVISAKDEFGKILQKEFDGKFQMHRTKCTAVIENVLAPRFKCKLDKMAKEAPGYHSQLDE